MTAESIPLFVLWTRFLPWLLLKTGKFPRSARFSLVSRVDNMALDVLEDVIVAQYARHDRAVAIERISINLDKLRVMLRICHQLGHLDHRGYEHASRELDEAGRMTGGWLKQQRAPACGA